MMIGSLDRPAWTPPDEIEEYRLVRLLGVGAMGQVYLAHDRLLDRLVALKFVDTEEPAARARVIEEARAIARLAHPNVVAIYRVSEIDGHPFLVSEYVRGRALNELARPMPPRQVLALALDLARGLAAAHRRGVLHRDVKPANAILTHEGRAKLLDFGLARILKHGTDEDMASDAAVARDLDRLPDRDPGSAAIAVGPAESARIAIAHAATAASTEITSPRTDPQPHPVGTPMFMAPEVWRGEPATRRSDLYSLGIVLYEMLTGTAPYRGITLIALAAAVQDRAIPPLASAAPEVPPALAAIIDRLVEREPAARFASADALIAALEQVAAPPADGAFPGGNPYRGLAAFDAAHGASFFGRRGEVRELVDRVRTDAFVVVGGDSGTGKSSLCRAGALPQLAAHDGWLCVEVVPGRHPVRALAVALAPSTGHDEATLAAMLRDDPDAVARALRQPTAEPGPSPAATGDPAPPRPVPPRRLLVFVDQLEELLTLSDPGEARAMAAALAALAVRTPSLRVLATCRADFLSRIAKLPGLGEEMARGLYFLRPLAGEQVREVIVRPAAARGVTFESEALIDRLVEQTEHAPGGLPLLSFTLAELWDARDAAARTIRAEALDALGGVGGALSRHADRLLAGLSATERDAARRILLRLVSSEGTRTHRTQAELVGEGPAGDASRTALEVLVRGRVVVASNTDDGAYQIAHEALLSSWSTLHAWRAGDAATHALRERIERAAVTWQRMGRARDLLWGARQLAEARTLATDSLAPREAQFLAAARAAIRRRRVLAAASLAVLVIGAVSVGLTIRARARRELEAVIAAQLSAAMTAQVTARQIGIARDVAQDRAFELFDARRWREGEDAWTGVEATTSREDRMYRAASGHLESALLLDPGRAGLRDWFADLTFERLVRAEHDRARYLTDELAARVLAYGAGRYQVQLAADARVELTVLPAGTQVWSERPGAPRQRLGTAPLRALSLPAGSLVLVFEAPGRATARLPVLLARDETVALRVVLPPAASAPPGMLYVPPGRFLFGSADGSDLRRGFFNTVPLHEVATDGYFIAQHEVSFAAWIEFLDQLPPDERRRRSPSSNTAEAQLALTELGPGRWRFTMKPTTRTYAAETGQRLRYERRSHRADQDWMKFPVSAVSYEDAIAFAGWLDRTGRIPGARLCDEYEWERAARGADARTFPSGAELAPDDANIDVTYGREPLAFGPDEVGSHPGSRSPVGADDMAGNVWEWTRSVQSPGAPVARGGSWYQGELSARSMNRAESEPTERHFSIGVRLCATPR